MDSYVGEELISSDAGDPLQICMMSESYPPPVWKTPALLWAPGSPSSAVRSDGLWWTQKKGVSAWWSQRRQTHGNVPYLSSFRMPFWLLKLKGSIAAEVPNRSSNLVSKVGWVFRRKANTNIMKLFQHVNSFMSGTHIIQVFCSWIQNANNHLFSSHEFKMTIVCFLANFSFNRQLCDSQYNQTSWCAALNISHMFGEAEPRIWSIFVCTREAY